MNATCFDDDVNDTTRELEQTSEADAMPRADIVRHCIRYGRTLQLRVEVAEPTDPATDPRWQGQTFASWTLDLDGDGLEDRRLTLQLQGDSLAVEVSGLEGQEVIPAPECAGVPSFDGRAYLVSGIASACAQDLVALQAQVAFVYDSNTDRFDSEANGGYWIDSAPGRDAFSEPIERQDADPRTVDRLAGATRIETAIEVSRRQFSGGAGVVYLASAEVTPDALVAGTLTDGPVLLVPAGCGPVPGAVLQEVRRLDPSSVVAVGGSVRVCDDVLRQAADA